MHDFDLRHGEHLLAELAVVWFVVYDALDATLDDHLGAELAREAGRVQGRAHGALATGLHDRRLLGVQAHALVEVNALLNVVVAAFAAAFVAVRNAEGRAVVAGRHHSIIFSNDSSISFLHAVAPAGSQLSQAHEVRIESGPHQLFVGEVEARKLFVELFFCWMAVVESPLNKLLMVGIAGVVFEVEVVESDEVVQLDELLQRVVLLVRVLRGEVVVSLLNRRIDLVRDIIKSGSAPLINTRNLTYMQCWISLVDPSG